MKIWRQNDMLKDFLEKAPDSFLPLDKYQNT